MSPSRVAIGMSDISCSFQSCFGMGDISVAVGIGDMNIRLKSGVGYG